MGDMNRHKLFLAISMASRIGTGMVMLLFLARALGPGDYGFVVTVFAYAQLVALLTDFGFSVQALRDIGAEPQRAGAILSACLRVKNILVVVASMLALGVLFSLPLRPDLTAACVLLYISTIAQSYGDLSLIVFRGLGKYDLETRIVVVGTVFFALIVGATALLIPEILPVSIALAVARLGQAGVAIAAVSRAVRLENWLVGPPREVWLFARQSSGLALDTVLTVLLSQMDIIFVSAMLGLEATGVYQVASRSAALVLLPSQVLSGVYLPNLARAQVEGGSRSNRLENKYILEYSISGVVIGVSFFVLFSGTYKFVFGDRYDIPYDIWAGFGVLISLRYITSILGTILISRRNVISRIIAQIVGGALLAILLLIFLPLVGLSSSSWSLAVSIGFTAFLYSLGLRAMRRETSNETKDL